METNEAFQWIIIFGIYGWMIASDVVFIGQPQIAGMSKIVSMVLMLGSLFIMEAYCRWAAAEFFGIKAVLRPSEQILNLFVNRSGITSEPHPSVPNLFVTTLPLGVKTTIKPYGKEPISEVTFKHYYDFDKRMIPTKGKMTFKGNVIDHNSMCTVVLYEYPEGSSDVDHATPIPSFYLANANGDFNLGPIEPSSMMLHNSSEIAANFSNPEDVVSSFQAQGKRLRILEQQLGHERAMSSRLRSDNIHKETMITQLKEELGGVLRNPLSLLQSVIQYVQAYVSAGKDIEQLGKKQFGLRSLPKWIMYPIILGIVLVFIAAVPDIRVGLGEWLSFGNNQIFLLIIVAMVLVIIYYVSSRRSSEK